MKTFLSIIHRSTAALVVLVAIFSTVNMAISVSPVYASDPCDGAADKAKCQACESLKIAGGECNEAEARPEVTGLVTRVINVLSLVIGAISVLMVVVGGFRYIISGGDSTGVSGAKDTILYAVVGLVVALFAQVLVIFVLSKTKL